MLLPLSLSLFFTHTNSSQKIASPALCAPHGGGAGDAGGVRAAAPALLGGPVGGAARAACRRSQPPRQHRRGARVAHSAAPHGRRRHQVRRRRRGAAAAGGPRRHHPSPAPAQRPQGIPPPLRHVYLPPEAAGRSQDQKRQVSRFNSQRSGWPRAGLRAHTPREAEEVVFLAA